MKKYVFVGLVAGLIGSALTGAVLSKTLMNFYTKDIRFDESMGEKHDTPKVPKSWAFVGVTKGRAINTNNLFFRDKDGNIFIVQVNEGEKSYEDMWIAPKIGKINVDPKK
jgi:hypothetical protein